MLGKLTSVNFGSFPILSEGFVLANAFLRTCCKLPDFQG
jgi:hypothetical protein